jgi:Protein of unknown function (DUF1592)/Protein of unknown function (DUF1588)/Protein of unknown function (DUF1587)/Protein of unknown function (DUF1595)/Protein of unknown function (DUF1585)/Planctomycete cytochrome C
MMRFFFSSLLLLLTLVWGSSNAAPAGENSTALISYEKEIKPLLSNYCYECHADGINKAGLALDSYETVEEIKAARSKWEGVLRNVSQHQMPPDDDGPVPSNAERDLISRFVEQELFKLDPAHPDPGRVVLRRLNRAEYNATIRDLVGVDFKPAADFPPDDSGYGFDNIGDVLSLPPVLLEKYLTAADRVMDAAIVTDPIKSEVRRIPASLAQIGFNAVGDRGDGWVQLISLEEDDAAVELSLPAGDYLMRVQAFATKVGGALKGQGSEKPLEFKDDPGPTKFALMLNDTFIQDFVASTDEAKPQVYETRIGVPAGRQRFRAAVLRKRGGPENELFMLNGRLGQQQPGIVYVKWLEIEGPLPAATRRSSADKLEAPEDSRLTSVRDRVLQHDGEVSMAFEAIHETDVILRAQAYAQQAGAEPARMEFRIDGKPVKTFEVLAPATAQPLPGQRVFSTSLLVAQPHIYEVHTRLAPGAHRFAAAFVNDFADPTNANPNLTDRNLFVQNLEVADLSQPVITPEKPAPIAKLFAQTGKTPEGKQTAAARKIMSQFTRRAWRRPVEAGEIDRLMKLYGKAREQGDSFEAGVKLAMKAVLISPHFLFIGETRNVGSKSPTPRPLNEVTLASRLSYFLWSSMPDDELLNLAERGELRKALPAQVRRMLASPKAHALVENFAGQWLQTRSLETFAPDRKLFPEFDPVLRAAMERETELFFEHVMTQDRSLFDFLIGDYTFVNARLAKFYGFPGITGDEFQKVSLAGTPRRGVLTQASILTLTSNPTRTSPVKRGKWVLENLLGTPPPPPPPNIPELDDKSRQLAGTLRQQMEQHRTNATCASCHARMDPIGFGLENFNAIGGWRDKEGEVAIDASGKLGGSDAFDGAADLTRILAEKKRWEFLHCLSDRMLTYALGRGTEYYDRPALDQIVREIEQGEDKFSALILAVAESFPFQTRRGDELPPANEVATR